MSQQGNIMYGRIHLPLPLHCLCPHVLPRLPAFRYSRLLLRCSSVFSQVKWSEHKKKKRRERDGIKLIEINRWWKEQDAEWKEICYYKKVKLQSLVWIFSFETHQSPRRWKEGQGDKIFSAYVTLRFFNLLKRAKDFLTQKPSFFLFFYVL